MRSSSTPKMTLKLFYDIISQPARAVLIFCKVNSINFTPCPIAMRKNELQSEEFVKVNPMRRIPAIQDGDFVLTESFAIMKYISAKYGCASHWVPADLQLRARMEEYALWHHGRDYLRGSVTPYFINKAITPRMSGIAPDKAVQKELWEKILASFTMIESYFLKDNPFIGGEEITVGDLLGVCEVMQLAGAEKVFMKDHPILKAWVHRVRKETNPHFDEAHKIIYKLGNVTDPSAVS